MGKKPQKCRKNCTKHHFILKPVDYFAQISRSVDVSFCPPTLKDHAIFPTFNRDSKYYTSSFFLKEDQAKYCNNDAIYKKEHINYCMQQLNGKSQMLQPKPKTKTSFCNLCKYHYQDYNEHIKSQNHKTCININKFSTYINDLIKQKYSPNQPVQQEFNSLSQEQSAANEKEGNSNMTYTSSLAFEQPPINQGFTFVSGQGACELRNSKISILKSQGIINQIRQALSPNFQNLLKRCSTLTNKISSQKKSFNFTKFPIIVTPLE